MHGRLKVKTTAEQAEAKRLEREKKLIKYRQAMKLIFHKRDVKELDTEMLHVTEPVLQNNPDIYTLWNIRREVFLQFSLQKTTSEMQKLFTDEMTIIESCLRVNPKSYSCWHQRRWVLKQMSEADWMSELYLCNKYLEYDERNFHCWDYRRFITKEAAVSNEEELEFTLTKIRSNFSNYSSWHYRSKLLMAASYTAEGRHNMNRSTITETQHGVLPEDTLLKELDLVQNAFFTDPDDQSAWLYQRWLLGKGTAPLFIRQIAYCSKFNNIIVSFSKAITVNEHCLTVRAGSRKITGVWSAVACSSWIKYSPVWIFIPEENPVSMLLEVSIDNSPFVSCFAETTSDSVFKSHMFKDENEFRMSLTLATRDVLVAELNSCLQLHELEPLNKWALLTIVLLMATIDIRKYIDDISQHLDALMERDPKRTAYYCDLRSRFTCEVALLSVTNTDVLDLSSSRLTCVSHPNHMTYFTHIDLSQNRLISTRGLHFMRLVNVVNLDQNNISTLDSFYLPHLKELSVQHNSIQTIEALSSLSECPSLETVRIYGNPVCALLKNSDPISFLPRLSCFDGLCIKQ